MNVSGKAINWAPRPAASETTEQAFATVRRGPERQVLRGLQQRRDESFSRFLSSNRLAVSLECECFGRAGECDAAGQRTRASSGVELPQCKWNAALTLRP